METKSFSQLKSAVGDFAGAAAETVAAKSREQASTWVESLEETVRENPKQALVTAIAAGFLVGLVVYR